MNILQRIDDLQNALKIAATKTEMDRWWSDYTSIKYRVADDTSATQYERDTVDRLGTGMTQLMVGIRDKLPSPDKTSASVSLAALRNSIAARTVGADGYKMK
jgi:hypothetical protein